MEGWHQLLPMPFYQASFFQAASFKAYASV
jgi:hypothetical protein